MQFILIVLLIFCVIVDVCLVFFTVIHPGSEQNAGFTLLCCMLLVYTLGYLVEILSQTAEAATAALVVENFAIPNIAPYFLLTSLGFFTKVKIQNWYLGAVLGYGMFFFIIVLTNSSHHLYYTSIEMIHYSNSNFAELGRGPLYFVNQIVTVACMLVSYNVIIVKFIHGSEKLRHQMRLFVAASAVGFFANILNFSAVLPPGLDPTPFAIAFGLVLFSVSLVRDDLIDVVVRARNVAVETMDAAIVVLDADADFLYCNKRAVQMFPVLQRACRTEAIVGLEGWPKELEELERQDEVTFTDCNERHYHADIQEITNETEKHLGYSIIIRDTTRDVMMIEQLEVLATTDPLTGILNRRQLITMIERELAQAVRYHDTYAVILFDVDHFKRVNDTYGHDMGDRVLTCIAEVVSSNLRQYDLFGRFGGEEFVIFTRSSGYEGVYAFCERLRQVIEQLHLQSEEGPIRITASFGAAQIGPGGDLREAIQKADGAMYQAKSSGRNRVVIKYEKE